jgi:hypothetical protein
VSARPCEDMPPPKIRLPIPGDTVVEITDSEPGAEIVVYVNGKEAGQTSARRSARASRLLHTAVDAKPPNRLAGSFVGVAR